MLGILDGGGISYTDVNNLDTEGLVTYNELLGALLDVDPAGDFRPRIRCGGHPRARERTCTQGQNNAHGRATWPVSHRVHRSHGFEVARDVVAPAGQEGRLLGELRAQLGLRTQSCAPPCTQGYLREVRGGVEPQQYERVMEHHNEHT